MTLSELSMKNGERMTFWLIYCVMPLTSFCPGPIHLVLSIVKVRVRENSNTKAVLWHLCHTGSFRVTCSHFSRTACGSLAWEGAGAGCYAASASTLPCKRGEASRVMTGQNGGWASPER